MGSIQKLKWKIIGIQWKSCGTHSGHFIRTGVIYTDRMPTDHWRDVLHCIFSWQGNHLV